MGTQKFIFIALVLSLLAHVLLVNVFSLRIETKEAPVIYCWPDILSESDLFVYNRDINFPPGVDFSSAALARDSFGTADFKPFPLVPQAHVLGALISCFRLSENRNINRRDYRYLWAKPIVFDAGNEEKVAYRVFVSGKGKVVFLYPCKLALNSQGSIYTQEYIREAALFYSDKFAWTKLEEVVQ